MIKKEFEQALLIGGAVTLAILSMVHDGLSSVEMVTFWAAVHTVATGTAWWTMDKIKKCRDAWGCNHG